MKTNEYLSMLVEDFHSSTVATIGADGRPQTRVIDMMLWDEAGVYFLTAKGKEFYRQLMEQQYIALSATKDKRSVSLRGKSGISAPKNLTKFFLRILICRKFTLEIRKLPWRCFRSTRQKGSILISAILPM